MQVLLGDCAEGSTALDAFGLGLLCFCLVFPGLAQGGLYAAPTISAIDGLFRLPDGPSADKHRAMVHGIMVRDLERVRGRLLDAALDDLLDPFTFAHLTHLLHHEPGQRLQLLDMGTEGVQALVEGYARRLGHLRGQRDQARQAAGAVVHEVFTFSPPAMPAVGSGREVPRGRGREDEGRREGQGPEGRGEEGPTAVSLRHASQSHSMVRHDVRLFSLDLSEAGEPQPEQPPTSPHDAALPQCDETQTSSPCMAIEEGPTTVSFHQSHSMVRHDVRLFSLDLSGQDDHPPQQVPWVLAPTHDTALPAPEATPDSCLQDSCLEDSRAIVSFVYEPAARPGPPPTVEGSGLHLITSSISSIPASSGVEEGSIGSSVHVPSAYASAANALTGESWMQRLQTRPCHRGGRRRRGGRRHRRRRGVGDTKQAATHDLAAASRLAEKERLRLHLQELFRTRKCVPASMRPRRERRRQRRAPGVHRLEGEHLIQVIV